MAEKVPSERLAQRVRVGHKQTLTVKADGDPKSLETFRIIVCPGRLTLGELRMTR